MYGPRTTAWPSQETLAADSGYDRRTIIRVVKHAAHLGLVQVERTRTPQGRGANRYALTWPQQRPGLVTEGHLRRCPTCTNHVTKGHTNVEVNAEEGMDARNAVALARDGAGTPSASPAEQQPSPAGVPTMNSGQEQAKASNGHRRRRPTAREVEAEFVANRDGQLAALERWQAEHPDEVPA